MSDNFVDLSLNYVFKSSTQKCDHAQYIQPDDFTSDSYTHFSDKSTKGSVKSTKFSSRHHFLISLHHYLDIVLQKRCKSYVVRKCDVISTWQNFGVSRKLLFKFMLHRTLHRKSTSPRRLHKHTS